MGLSGVRMQASYHSHKTREEKKKKKNASFDF